MATKEDVAPEFQMPILPDPGKADDNQETLDFSVRLGSTLARGFESDRRQLDDALTQKPRRKDGVHGLDLKLSRKVSSVSVKSASNGEQTSRLGGKTSRSRKESRRQSNNNKLSTTDNTFVIDKETVIFFSSAKKL